MAEPGGSPSRARQLLRDRRLWLWLLTLALVVVLHFGGGNPVRDLLLHVSPRLTPCLIERLLFLLPVALAAGLWGTRAGALAIALSALAMLVRAGMTSCQPENTLPEIAGVLALAVLLAWTLSRQRAERQAREEAQRVGLERLRASEARYRGLFENASDAIWVQDDQGRVVDANAACALLTGYGQEELIGRPAGRFLSEPIRTGRHELVLRRKDGRQVFVELVAAPLPGDDRAPGWQCMARDITERRRREEATRLFARQVVQAQEEERRRIARELHDSTIQALAALSNHLEALTLDQGSLPPAVNQRVHKMQGIASAASEEVRRFCHDLRPPALDDLGLLPCLEELAADFRREQGLAVAVQVRGLARRLAPEVELALYRIVQESLTNVLRHARATEAIVHLRFAPDAVRVVVRDDGQGCELPEHLSDLTARGCLGLAGIYERAHLLGGTAEVRSAPGRGTVVSVEVPG